MSTIIKHIHSRRNKLLDLPIQHQQNKKVMVGQLG